MADFFGFGGYSRPAEGFLSWQHLTFVTLLMGLMLWGALVLGKKYKNAAFAQKNKVLIITALVLDGVELVKILLMCIRSDDPMYWKHCLPLFLCSIQLIAVPMAAFCRGRIREASLDFVAIFGMLGAVLGTYGAGNNYGTYPVLSLDNVASGITHTLSGFAALYILLTGMAQLKKENMWFTYVILGGFCVVAYGVDILWDLNYMFLMRGDGTPYEILYSLTGGSPILYPIAVVVLFLVYISVFYWVHSLAKKKKELCV